MTLLLTALTPRHIVQVSDRRVVWQKNDQIVKTEDSYVKAVLTSSFACSYTGLANLGSGDTADWIATVLSDHTTDPDRGITSLMQAATQQLSRRTGDNQKLGIVCAGWIVKSETKRFMPRATVISNFGASSINHEFQAQTISVHAGRLSCVFPQGQIVHQEELDVINRTVEKLCESGRDSARAIAQALTETVRMVARSPSRSPYVSEDVLVSSLPRPDLLKGLLVVGKLVEDYWSVTCIPRGKTRIEQHGGPIIVGHKAAIQALPPEDRPPGEGLFVGARIVRKPEFSGALSCVILTNPPLGHAWGWPG
ncbi:MAG: hypothetical protein KIT40_15915 [Nitrospira sp.]|nr:hypothetical protein [Nitrospira sp.]